MNSANRALAALVAGLAAGAAAAAAHVAPLVAAVPALEVAGNLWINAIRMTVIPLVVALTVTSSASDSGGSRLGRTGALAVAVFVVLLVAGGILAMIVVPFAFDQTALAADATASLRASAAPAAGAAVQMPSLLQRIVDIVPTNPVKAAADGAILPLLVFSLAFGLALRRVADERRDAVVALFRALADATLVLVGWILRVAPIGVFALAFVLGARLGASSAGALLHYVATLSGTLFLFTLGLYPVVWLVGRTSLREFAVAAAPAQALAFSARSSLAALPLMVSGARDRLHLPPATTGFVLPLAVSLFRVNVPIAWVVGVAFLGKLYGIPVSEAQLALLVVTSTLLSFSVPGIPSASLFLMAPVLVDLGLPAEGVGVLIAVDAIPDMFKTLANVTAHMTSATVLARFSTVRPGRGAAT